MSMNRWKVLACTLTIGVGGLAVFAAPPAGDKKEAPKEVAKEPAPLPEISIKPASPANGDDTIAPIKQAKAEVFDLQIPDVPLPTRNSEPVFEPITPALPAKAESKEPPMVLPPVPELPAHKQKEPGSLPGAKTLEQYVGHQTPAVPTPDLDIPILATGGETPTVKSPDSKAPEAPKPAEKTTPPLPATPSKPDPLKVPEIDFGPVPLPQTKPEPVAPLPPVPMITPPLTDSKPPLTKPMDTPIYTPMVPPSTGISQPVPPSALIPPVAPSPTKPTESAHLKMLLRMGDGQPRFEIRNSASTDLLLKVYGEKIEMQSPQEGKTSLAGVSAIGHVKFTAPGIEGTCDQLTILSATGEMLLKGNIHLKTKKGKIVNEMTAEKMVYQIGTAGLNSGDTRPAVRPASYIPD
jgi:hypothetical protein